MKAIILIVNVIFFGLALPSGVGLYVSKMGATSKFAEFDRAGCINHEAMEKYSEDRFIYGDRQGTVLWLAQPVYKIAVANFGLSIFVATANLILVIILMAKNRKSKRT